jgi:Peptidase family M23
MARSTSRQHAERGWGHRCPVVGLTCVLALASLAGGCSVPSEPAAPSATVPVADASASGRHELTPVLASVLDQPVPFDGSDGHTHLVYELQLTNFTPSDLTIDRVDVLDADSGEPVQTLGARAVRDRLQTAGVRESEAGLGAAQMATLFVHVTLAPGETVPETLTHKVSATVEGPAGPTSVTELVGRTSVDKRTLPVLAPPLAGRRIVAADACCDATRHTRAILPIDGQLFVSQRYAIDYERLDENDRIYVGDRLDPSSYRIYGDKALAVAEGTVVMTINDLEEQTPGKLPDDIPIEEADGNSVVIDLGDGFFANYAHFQPGSVRVQVGDRVQPGDVLGLVGNSGNSLAPHLHFHVSDGPSPLAAQGLPYLIDSFTVTGRGKSTAAFDKAEADGTPLPIVDSGDGAAHTDQLVLDQRIVTFPSR